MLMAAHCDLRASALLALTKLMAVERELCDANLRLLFTLLAKGCARPAPPPLLVCDGLLSSVRHPTTQFCCDCLVARNVSQSAPWLGWGLLVQNKVAVRLHHFYLQSKSSWSACILFSHALSTMCIQQVHAVLFETLMPLTLKRYHRCQYLGICTLIEA